MSKNNLRSLTPEQRVAYARKIRELRQKQNMTQAELALKAGISRATLINLEMGNTTPIYSVLEHVFDALGVTVEDDPTFRDDTRLVLTVFGTLIEAIAPNRRGEAIDTATNVFAEAIRKYPNLDVGRTDEDELATLPLDPNQYDLAASTDGGVPIDGGHIEDDNQDV